MKALILGKGGHGKDTFAEMLSELTGFRFTSSSRAVLDVIFPALDASIGYSGERLDPKEFAYEDRRNNRVLWKELITLYNTPDKAALCKKILSTNDMYVGMRSNEEYEASKDLFDLIFYVDAGERVEEEDPTMKIERDPFNMHLVDNSKGKDNLYDEAEFYTGVIKGLLGGRWK